MTTPAVARLTDPGEILAALPSLCGFPPTESVVVMSLRGPRRRVGLTVRLDLPPAEPGVEQDAARLLVDRVQADGAGDVVVAVYAEDGRREGLVDAVREQCAGRGIGVLEALHVRAGRWTSYTCTRPCCPASGTPLPADSSTLRLIQAERALAGRAVLGSREELVRSVAPPTLLAAAQAEQHLDEATAAWVRHREQYGAAASRTASLTHADLLLEDVAAGRPVGPGDAARLAVGLADLRARDEVATRALEQPEELLSLLLQVVRQVVPPDDAHACALLAWVAYVHGDGALVNVALDRALDSEPEHSLATLLRTCLDAGIAPAEVRDILRGTQRALSGGPPARRAQRRGNRRRLGPTTPG